MAAVVMWGLGDPSSPGWFPCESLVKALWRASVSDVQETFHFLYLPGVCPRELFVRIVASEGWKDKEEIRPQCLTSLFLMMVQREQLHQVLVRNPCSSLGQGLEL
jgi:hypothetical protein